jgi:arylsulfatase A-like enzyme
MNNPIPARPSDTREPGAASLLLIAVGLGLLAGLVEVVALAIKRAMSPQVVFQTEDIIWMAPVADALFLLALGGTLVVLQKVLRFIPSWVIVFLLATLSAFIMILSLGPLHIAAQILIAAGIGVQLARLARTRGASMSRTARRGTPLLAGLVLLLGVGLHLRRGWTERSGVSRLAPAETGAPNVILLVLDTVRWFNLSSYGYPRPTTPEIEKWSRGAVRFDQALATAPWTLPSHVSLFTGRLPHETSATWLVPMDGAQPTLAEVLAEHGYATAGFVANLNYTSRESGLSRGFLHYEDYRIRPAEILFSSALGKLLVSTRTTQWRMLRKSAALVNDEFLGWLDDRPEGRPFFVFLNYFDAHDPYEPPAPFDAQFGAAGGGDVDDLESRSGRGTSARLQAAQRAYDGTIAYMDQQIGRLLSELERRQLKDNTILIITSDHGEQFGEKGLIRHGNSLYRTLVQVPLFVSVPGVTTGRRDVATPVSLRDVPATILDFAGIERHPLPGRSLAPLVRDSNGASSQGQALLMELDYSDRLPKRGPIRFGSMKAVMDSSGLRMIRNGNGKRELYAAGDWFDSLDLASQPESAPLLARLDSLLTQLAPASAGAGRAPRPHRPGAP